MTKIVHFELVSQGDRESLFATMEFPEDTGEQYELLGKIQNFMDEYKKNDEYWNFDELVESILEEFGNSNLLANVQHILV